MKTSRPTTYCHNQTGFTLVEMIGVLAILAIIAATITPNALRVIEREAVRNEASVLGELGGQVKAFLQTKGWPPGLNPSAANRLTWERDLASFADYSAADILTNKRRMARSYIYEPVASPRRVLILSSMRAGLALPTAANLNSVALFDNVWNTPDGSIPPAGTSWAGWTAWRNSLSGTAGDYLVIERVNLSSIYNTELKTITIILNNRSATPVSYNILLADGTAQPPVNIPAPVAPATNMIANVNVKPRDRVNLYRSAGGVNLDCSYIVSAGSTGQTFNFNSGTNWAPLP